jgi:rhodanese-related sulfurtransferase
MDATHSTLSETAPVGAIAPKELLQLMASGRRVVVIDVREADETDRSPRRLRGALGIPAHQIFVRRDDLPARPADLIVTVSNTGARSRDAALTLALLGFHDVRSLEGGLDAWVRLGLPLD